MSDDVGKLLRKLDRALLPRGFHDHADSALFYVGRASSGKLYTERANIPSLDHHPDLVPTEILHTLATEAVKARALPIDNPLIVGLAWTMEAYMGSVAKDTPLHVMDQFEAARAARELHKWPDSTETRVITVVLRDGAEGALVRKRSGEVWLSLGPQTGLVLRSLRLLCGRPEDDPVDVMPSFENIT